MVGDLNKLLGDMANGEDGNPKTPTPTQPSDDDVKVKRDAEKLIPDADYQSELDRLANKGYKKPPSASDVDTRRKELGLVSDSLYQTELEKLAHEGHKSLPLQNDINAERRKLGLVSAADHATELRNKAFEGYVDPKDPVAGEEIDLQQEALDKGYVHKEQFIVGLLESNGYVKLATLGDLVLKNEAKDRDYVHEAKELDKIMRQKGYVPKCEFDDLVSDVTETFLDYMAEQRGYVVQPVKPTNEVIDEIAARLPVYQHEHVYRRNVIAAVIENFPYNLPDTNVAKIMERVNKGLALLREKEGKHVENDQYVAEETDEIPPGPIERSLISPLGGDSPDESPGLGKPIVDEFGKEHYFQPFEFPDFS